MQRIRGKQQNGKTKDLFKKIRDTKGTFHAKMGLIKDQNCMDLTEAEDIKKRLPRPAQARVAPAQGENGASPLRKIRERQKMGLRGSDQNG